MANPSSNQNRYQTLIEKIFLDRYDESATELIFDDSSMKGELVIQWGRKLKNKGNAIITVQIHNSLLDELTEAAILYCVK